MTTVKVCDAIMGSGKSQSAIAYMNEHSQRKFVYITPYLDETKRIQEACPSLRFVCPSKEEEEDGSGWTKIQHIRRLIAEGRNVSTTHAAFRLCTSEILEGVKARGYTLIIDEAVQVLGKLKVDSKAVDILSEAGYIDIHENGSVEILKDFRCSTYDDLYCVGQRNNLVRVLDGEGRDQNDVLYYSELPAEFITSFADVFVLTYLFAGSEMKCYFDLKGIPYEYIGVARDENGYHFAPTNE